MPTYRVRIIETHDLVGIFTADNILQLIVIVIVDECSEPDDCEYTRLPSGGIMWAGLPIPAPVTPPEDPDGADQTQCPQPSPAREP
jgi:hypothetical protein